VLFWAPVCHLERWPSCLAVSMLPALSWDSSAWHQRTCSMFLPPASLYWWITHTVLDKGLLKQVCLQARRISHHMVPNSNCPPSLAVKFVSQVRIFPQVRYVYRLLGEPTPGQSSPKWEKLILDSSRISMRSVTWLSFSAAEKSVTVQTQAQK